MRNHDEWSGLGWTLPLLAVLIPIIDLLAAAATWYSPRTLIPSIVNGPCNARAVVLQTASWAFLVSAAEITVHLVVAQAEAEFDSAFWVALLLIIGLANLVPYVLTIAIWRAWIFYQGCLSSPYWALPECALGCGLLFFLGTPGLFPHRPPAALALALAPARFGPHRGPSVPDPGLAAAHHGAGAALAAQDATGGRDRVWVDVGALAHRFQLETRKTLRRGWGNSHQEGHARGGWE